MRRGKWEQFLQKYLLHSHNAGREAIEKGDCHISSVLYVTLRSNARPLSARFKVQNLMTIQFFKVPWSLL